MRDPLLRQQRRRRLSHFLAGRPVVSKTCLAAVLFVVFVPFSWPQEPAKKDPSVVTLASLRAAVPASWVSEKPANRLRAYQFRWLKVKDDKEDAELIIFPNISGSAEENLERWKEMFLPPDDKTAEDIARAHKFGYGKVKVLYLDMAGTYLYKDRPLAKKAEPKPGYRMFSVLFETPGESHVIRAVGPAKTMTHHKKAFDDWLRSFK